MTEPILEPYAVNVRWTTSAPVLSWEGLIADYFEAIARRCQEMGPCVIGHIKGLAIFDEGGYLRISVVSSDRPADLEGRAPPETTSLLLSLNVIVYGIGRDTLERISREEVHRMTEKWKGTVRVEEA
jgi:hypothetical protein